MTTRTAVLVFGALYATLALVIASEVSSTRSAVPSQVDAAARAGVRQPRAARVADVPVPQDLTQQLVNTVLARPLFAPGRRPPALATDGRSAAPRLSGIVVWPAGRVAMVQATSGKRTNAVAKGGVVDGWTVADITSDTITVQRAGDSVTLGLKFAAQTAVAAAVPAAPAKPPPPSRWVQAAESGILRSRWSDPHLQPRRRRYRAGAPRRYPFRQPQTLDDPVRAIR
jgi:hypothetical protein